MLDRASSPALLSTTELVSLRPGWTVGSASGLMKFLGLLVLISGLTCLYLWQASTISSIERDTFKLNAEVEILEIENVDLMLQVQQWYAPAYVEGQARARGMVVVERQTYVELPLESNPTPSPEQHRRAAAEALWRQATSWANGFGSPVLAAQFR